MKAGRSKFRGTRVYAALTAAIVMALAVSVVGVSKRVRAAGVELIHATSGGANYLPASVDHFVKLPRGTYLVVAKLWIGMDTADPAAGRPVPIKCELRVVSSQGPKDVVGPDGLLVKDTSSTWSQLGESDPFRSHRANVSLQGVVSSVGEGLGDNAPNAVGVACYEDGAGDPSTACQFSQVFVCNDKLFWRNLAISALRVESADHIEI